MILAIETSSPVCGVSLHDKSRCLSDIVLHEPRVHAEKLVAVTDQLLQRESVAVEALEGIVVSSGPGSFTGLRIGMSFAKGLAYPHRIPLGGVNTLKGFMFFYHEKISADIKTIFVIRSHRDYIYWANASENPANIRIHYDTLERLNERFTCPVRFISNEEIPGEKLKGNIVVHPLSPQMVGHYFFGYHNVSLTTNYQSVGLEYGMDYKPKVWNKKQK